MKFTIKSFDKDFDNGDIKYLGNPRMIKRFIKKIARRARRSEGKKIIQDF